MCACAVRCCIKAILCVAIRKSYLFVQAETGQCQAVANQQLSVVHGQALQDLWQPSSGFCGPMTCEASAKGVASCASPRQRACPWQYRKCPAE